MQRSIVIVIVVSLLIIILSLALIILFPSDPREQYMANQRGEAAIGGDFTLKNPDGQVVHSQDFKGKLLLVYFGFTFCPDICLTTMQVISEALSLLGDDAKKVQAIFITIDPERDTTEQLKLYLEHFDPRIIALTGTAAEIKKVAENYRVYYAKSGNTPDYMVNHSSFIYLMDQNGKYITHFSNASKASDIAKTIKPLL